MGRVIRQDGPPFAYKGSQACITTRQDATPGLKP
jgi:hypothetical protein